MKYISEQSNNGVLNQRLPKGKMPKGKKSGMGRRTYMPRCMPVKWGAQNQGGEADAGGDERGDS